MKDLLLKGKWLLCVVESLLLVVFGLHRLLGQDLPTLRGVGASEKKCVGGVCWSQGFFTRTLEARIWSLAH